MFSRGEVTAVPISVQKTTVNVRAVQLYADNQTMSATGRVKRRLSSLAQS